MSLDIGVLERANRLRINMPFMLEPNQQNYDMVQMLGEIELLRREKIEALPEGLTVEIIAEAADYLRTVADQAKLVTQFAGIDLKYFDKETLINLLVFVEVDRAFREGREVKEKSFADSLAIVGRIPGVK